MTPTEEILKELKKGDGLVVVATAMGRLAKIYDYDPDVVAAMLAAWQTWRDDHGQGPIPDDWRISG